MRAGLVGDLVDEEPLLHADLRRGEPDAGRVVHRLVHRVDELHEAAVDVGDLGRRPLQHRIAEDADGVSRHGEHGSGAPRDRPRRHERVGCATIARGGSTTARTRPIARPAGRPSRERVGEHVPVGRVARARARRSARTPARRWPARRARAARRSSAASASSCAGQLGERAERRVPERAPVLDLGRRRPRRVRRARAPARPRGRECASAAAAASRGAAAPRAAARRGSAASAPARRRGTAARAAPGRDRGTRRARAGAGAPRRGAAPPRCRRRCRRRARRRSRRRPRRRARPAPALRAPRGPASTPGAQHPQLRRAALGAHERALVGLVPAQQVLARRAHEQPEPARRLSTQTAEPADVVQRGRRALRTAAPSPAAPRAGRRPATRGQPPASTSGGGASTTASAPAAPRRRCASTVGAGEHTVNGTPARRRPLAEHVARVPRGRALLLQRLVGVVDDDRRARDRAPARARRCGRRRRRTRRRAARCQAAVRSASVSNECSERDRAALRDRGTRRAHATAPRRRRRRSSIPPPRTAPRPAPAGRAAAAGGSPASRRGRVRPRAPSPRRGRRRPGATWFGADAERSTATRGPDPAPRDPFGQRDDVGRRPADTTASTSSSPAGPRSGSTVVVDRPSPAPAGRAAGRARSRPTRTDAASASGTE